MQHHKYSLNELENMLPWEREVYVSLLVNYLKEEKERREQEKNGENNGGRNKRCKSRD